MSDLNWYCPNSVCLTFCHGENGKCPNCERPLIWIRDLREMNKLVRLRSALEAAEKGLTTIDELKGAFSPDGFSKMAGTCKRIARETLAEVQRLKGN